MEDGTDNIAEDIQNLAQAIGLLADKVGAMDQMYDAMNTQMDKLNKLVMDDFIGGLQKLYDDNDREVGIRGLQDKYSETVKPYEGAMKAINPDFDVWDSMHKSLGEIKKSPGYNDEMGDSHIQSLISEMANRFGGVRDALSSLPPKEGSVEVTKVSGEPPDVDGDAEEDEAEEAPEISEKQKRMMEIARKLGSRVK